MKAVFLSYASQDAEAARRLCESLRAAGVEVWFDQSELRGGDAWDAKIRKQIRECALFVPVISANTQARLEGYFRLEWKLAAQRTHTMADAKPFLVPVDIDGTKESGAHVPAEFLAVQWTRLLEGGGRRGEGRNDPVFTTFAAQVAQLLANSEAAAGGDPVLSLSAQRPSSGDSPGLGGKAVAISRGSRRSFAGRWAALAAAVVLLVAGGGFWRSGNSGPSLQPLTAKSLATGESSAVDAPAYPREKVLLVLPLESLGDDPENKAFADGLHAEIIFSLQRNTDLRVIGRDSSLSLKRGSTRLADLAAQVSAGSVITGSVRRAGPRVRVLLEMRRASDETLLWSSPDQELPIGDLFDLQRRIADDVARALNARSAVGTNANARYLTRNPQAYELVMRANARFFDGTAQGLIDAVALDEQAFALDPNYVLPAFQIAAARCNLMYFDPKSRVQHAREAKRWAERAHDLDPMGVGANAMSIYLYWVEADYIGALAQTDRSLQTLPNDLATPTFRAVALSALGRTAEALVYFRQATQIDPLNIFAITNEIFALSDLRRAEQALRLMTASRAAIAADDTKLAFFDERMAYARLQLLGEFPSAQGVIPNSNWAAWCWIARDFAGAEKAATAALSTGDLSPGERFENLQIRHDSLKRLGRTDDAASVLVEMREAARFIQDEEEFGPSSKEGWLAKVEVRAGRIDAGLAAAQQYLEAAPLGTHPRLHWSRQIDVAELLAYLNRPEECAALLAPLLRVASGLTVPRLKADPVWDPVRNSAAFKALLADPKNNEPLF